MPTYPFQYEVRITVRHKKTPSTQDKLRATMHRKRASGESTGRVSLGYKIVYDEQGYNGRVVEDPSVMSLIQEAKALHAQGMTIRQLITVMTPRGLLTRNGTPMRPMDMWRVIKTESSNNWKE